MKPQQFFALSRAAGALAAVSASLPLAVQAGPATINATQLSITVAPISVSATKLGAEVSATGSGLTQAASVIPTIDAADGSITAGAALTAAINTTFSYAVSARSADAVAASNDLGASLTPTTAFGSQSGSWSSGTPGATIALTGAGAPTVTAGTGQGSTVSATYSSSTASDVASTSMRRIATSGNDQASFTATRQGSSFAASGSGLTAVTDGGLGAGAVGGAPTITALAGGASQENITFTASTSQLIGQDSSAITASSTNVTQAAYGVVSNTLGGTTAGAVTAATGFNSLGVAAGGQGTSATLSVIQSLTAF
jgi:hypothetical protein